MSVWQRVKLSEQVPPLGTQCVLLGYLISDDVLKISVMIGSLLCVFGSCERHSKLTEEMYIPLRPIPKEDCSSLMFL